MDDKTIIAQLWTRTEQVLETIAAKYGKRLYHTAMNILASRPDAEEAVNDTYMALWNTIPPQKPDPLSAYVYRTGRNIALKKLRFLTAQKRNTQLEISLEELSDIFPAPSIEQLLDARELGQAMDRFLSKVSKENRILFVRRYWYGDSVRSLAKAFGLSENNVSVRLSRLRGQLKDYLNQEGFFHEA